MAHSDVCDVHTKPCRAPQLWFSVVQVLSSSWCYEVRLCFGICSHSLELQNPCGLGWELSCLYVTKFLRTHFLCSVVFPPEIAEKVSTMKLICRQEESARQWRASYPSVCSLCQLEGKVRMCKDLGHFYRRFCGIVEEILQVAQGMAWAGVMMRVTFSREGSCLTEMICRTQTVSLLKDWRTCT